MRPIRFDIDRLASRTVRRLLVAAMVVAGVVMFVSCGGDGAGKITGPDNSAPTPPSSGTPPSDSTATPPGTGTTTPSDTTATPPATGGGGTPTDTSAAPGTGETTPPGTGTATPPAGTTPGTVTGINIVSPITTLTAGDSSSLSATLQTTGAPPSGGWTVTWQSSDTSVVVVSAVGKVRARTQGVAAVLATAGGQTASVILTVVPQPWVNSVTLSPASAALMVGDQTTFTALLGTVGLMPAGGWPVSWRSDDARIATVSASGVVTAVAPGATSIWVAAGARAASAGITVVSTSTVLGISLSPATLYLAPGAQGSFTPLLTTVGSAPAGGWPIAWSTVAPAIATVDAAGVVTAVAPGSTTISAKSGTKEALATIAVSTASGGTASVVSSVTIGGPSKVWMLVGGQKTLTTNVNASGPPPQDGWTITWTTSNPAAVTVSASGVVSGVAAGIATISATVGGVSGTRVVEVLPPPGVIEVRINTQDPSEIVQGDTIPLEVTHTLIGAIPAGGLVTTWSSSNPAVATVSAAGVVKGVTLGNATITATSYGKSWSVTFIVLTPLPPPPPPTVSGITGLSITPAVAVLATGGRGWIQANVTATTPEPQTTGLGWPVQWTSSSPAVVTMPTLLSQYLNYDALSEGTATITASLGGKTATSTIYVATPKSITVSPSAPSMSVGQQVTLTPTVTATGPLPSSGFPVGYQASSPLVASVSPAGVVTALGAGKTRIWVNAGPQQTTAIVTVTGPGLTLSLTGVSTLKGTIELYDSSYYLECSFPMSMSAAGSGTAIWGNEEWSYDGVLFKSYAPYNSQALSAGSSMVWRAIVGGSVVPTSDQVTGFTATARFHYGVNASSSDYPRGVAQDYVITQTYTCQR
jgi:uncharacterized protein YjdB